MTNQKHVIGIDASLSCTAVVSLDASLDHASATFGEKPAGEHIAARIGRYNRLVERIVENVESLNPLVICIEGYSFTGPNPKTLLQMAEFGSILRADLVTLEVLVYEVAPTMLKKFVTGSGAGKKLKMITDIQSRWGVAFGTHDEFDAYGLARLAACIAGTDEPTNQSQREVLVKLTGRDFEKSLKETVAKKGNQSNGQENCKPKAPF